MIIIFNSYNGAIVIEPIKRLKKSFYLCDKRFHLDEILEMYMNESKYGIVLISGSKTICYNIVKSGTHIDANICTNIRVKLQKRQRKGGQSAARFGRIRQEKEKVYVNKVVDMILASYMNQSKTKCFIKGLIIAGPAFIKHSVRNHPTIIKYFGPNILKILNISSITDNTVWAVYNKCLEELSDAEDKVIIKQIKMIKDLVREVDSKLVYGYDQVLDKISNGMLKSVLIPSTLSKDKKELLQQKSVYGCQIYVSKPVYLNDIPVDIIGIKWYGHEF